MSNTEHFKLLVLELHEQSTNLRIMPTVKDESFQVLYHSLEIFHFGHEHVLGGPKQHLIQWAGGEVGHRQIELLPYLFQH